MDWDDLLYTSFKILLVLFLAFEVWWFGQIAILEAMKWMRIR